MTTRIDEMFKAGAHFGYSKTRRHPTSSPYILGTKNRVDIIDLEKTTTLLEKAEEFAKTLGAAGKTLLFVGVKPEAKRAVESVAQSLNQPYVIERWVGGIITNFSEIKKRIAKLEELTKERESGEQARYTKKERLLIEREIERLEKYFEGLVGMTKIPDALFIVDPKRESNAIAEAVRAGIPVITLGNTDCDQKIPDYPIIANDSSVSSITFFVNAIKNAYSSSVQ